MNAFRILGDTQYKNQDILFELIFNTEKKLDRLKNKVEVAELKGIKNQAVKMLNNLVETYYFVEYEHCQVKISQKSFQLSNQR